MIRITDVISDAQNLIKKFNLDIILNSKDIKFNNHMENNKVVKIRLLSRNIIKILAYLDYNINELCEKTLNAHDDDIINFNDFIPYLQNHKEIISKIENNIHFTDDDIYILHKINIKSFEDDTEDDIFYKLHFNNASLTQKKITL